MNSKVAARIKDASRFVCAFGIIASIIVGIKLLWLDNAIGFLEIIIGAFISWLSYLILYGFGELIEYAEIIAKNISGSKDNTVPFKLNINKAITSEEKTDNI